MGPSPPNDPKKQVTVTYLTDGRMETQTDWAHHPRSHGHQGTERGLNVRLSVTLRVCIPSPCNEHEGFDPYYLSHVHLRALSKEKEVRRKRGREGERDHRKRGDGRDVKIPPACRHCVLQRTRKFNYGTVRDFSRINTFKCPQVKSQEILSDGDSE